MCVAASKSYTLEAPLQPREELGVCCTRLRMDGLLSAGVCTLYSCDLQAQVEAFVIEALTNLPKDSCLLALPLPFSQALDSS